MTPRDFTYWLQGCVETHEGETLSARQLQIIKDHLATVFDKQTPETTLLGAFKKSDREAPILDSPPLVPRPGRIC